MQNLYSVNISLPNVTSANHQIVKLVKLINNLFSTIVPGSGCFQPTVSFGELGLRGKVLGSVYNYRIPNPNLNHNHVTKLTLTPILTLNVP